MRKLPMLTLAATLIISGCTQETNTSQAEAAKKVNGCDTSLLSEDETIRTRSQIIDCIQRTAALKETNNSFQ